MGEPPPPSVCMTIELYGNWCYHENGLYQFWKTIILWQYMFFYNGYDNWCLKKTIYDVKPLGYRKW